MAQVRQCDYITACNEILNFVADIRYKMIESEMENENSNMSLDSTDRVIENEIENKISQKFRLTSSLEQLKTVQRERCQSSEQTANVMKPNISTMF